MQAHDQHLHNAVTCDVTRTSLASFVRIDVPKAVLTDVTLLAHDVWAARTLSRGAVALGDFMRFRHGSGYKAVAWLEKQTVKILKYNQSKQTNERTNKQMKDKQTNKRHLS